MSAADRIGARAEALGVWIGTHDPQTRVYPDGVDWNIGRAVDGSYSVRAVGSAVYETLPGGRRSTTGDRHWRLDETTAEVWLLALASGATVTRRCPDCEGSRENVIGHSFANGRFHGGGEIALSETIEDIERLGARARIVLEDGDGWGVDHVKDCPTCSAKGTVRVEAARLVCEAAQECGTCQGEGIEVDVDDERAVSDCSECDGSGEPVARTELLAVAYGLDPGALDEQRVRPCLRCNPSKLTPSFCLCPGRSFLPEPDEALVLRDYLADRGLAPADLTLDVLAEFGDPPATDFGRVLVAWLGGVACTLCSGQGSPAYQWFKCECSRCEATGLEVSALLAQVAS